MACKLHQFVLALYFFLTLVGCQVMTPEHQYRRHPDEQGEASPSDPSSTEDQQPQSDTALYDATNSVWDANDRAYEEAKQKAADGDPEAQRWMQQYGGLYEMTRNWSRKANEEQNRPPH